MWSRGAVILIRIIVIAGILFGCAALIGFMQRLDRAAAQEKTTYDRTHNVHYEWCASGEICNLVVKQPDGTNYLSYSGINYLLVRSTNFFEFMLNAGAEITTANFEPGCFKLETTDEGFTYAWNLGPNYACQGLPGYGTYGNGE